MGRNGEDIRMIFEKGTYKLRNGELALVSEPYANPYREVGLELRIACGFLLKEKDQETKILILWNEDGNEIDGDKQLDIIERMLGEEWENPGLTK